MAVKREERGHNGVTYKMIVDHDRTAIGSITYGEKKYELKGKPEIKRTLGSYKHGDEIQVAIFAKAGTTIERPRVQFEPNGDPKKHPYDRIEIFFNIDLFEDLVREYAKIKREEALNG